MFRASSRSISAPLRRGLLVVTVVGALMLGSVAPSSAHPAESFTACATFTRTNPNCYTGHPLTAGITVGEKAFFRARIQPAHEGARAQVWRLRPGATVWRQVGSVTVGPEGRIRWTWQTQSSDYIPGGRRYSFRFRVPNHGQSNAVLVEIVLGE